MDYMGRYMTEILRRFSHTSRRAFRLCGGGRSAVKLVDSLPLRRCKPTLSRRTRKAVEIPSCSHLAAAYFPPSPLLSSWLLFMGQTQSDAAAAAAEAASKMEQPPPSIEPPPSPAASSMEALVAGPSSSY